MTAEPPVMAGEVAGSVSERELLSAVFEGRAKLADAVAQHMSPPLPLIGAGSVVFIDSVELSTDPDTHVALEDLIERVRPSGVVVLCAAAEEQLSNLPVDGVYPAPTALEGSLA